MASIPPHCPPRSMARGPPPFPALPPSLPPPPAHLPPRPHPASLPPDAGSMASILKVLESQNLKKCDKDLGGCDRPGTPFRKLNAVPDVFTLLMAWEENVPGKDIKETLDLVDVEVMKFAGTRGGGGFTSPMAWERGRGKRRGRGDAGPGGPGGPGGGECAGTRGGGVFTLLIGPRGGGVFTSSSPPSVIRCCSYAPPPCYTPPSSTYVTCTTSPSPVPSACTPCSVTTASTTAHSSTTRR